jgi:hypothetical protein
MAMFTIKGYKVNSEYATMTAPDGQKYELHGQVPYWWTKNNKFEIDKYFIDVDGTHTSVDEYRLPIPEDLELEGEYLEQYNEAVTKWNEENTKWYSLPFKYRNWVRKFSNRTSMHDYIETIEFEKWFHPLWAMQYHGVWNGYSYDREHGLNAPTDEFMNDAIKADFRSYQRLQWINNPIVKRDSLKAAKALFKANIQPLVEAFIIKIESGEYAREQAEQSEWEEQQRIAAQARDQKLTEEYQAQQLIEKAEKDKSKKLMNETLEYAKNIFQNVPNTRVFKRNNPCNSHPEVIIAITNKHGYEDLNNFNAGDFTGIKKLASFKSGKPIKRK